jgi:adenosylmethionine-8-amino-7-oxononanoate aminotransferase
MGCKSRPEPTTRPGRSTRARSRQGVYLWDEAGKRYIDAMLHWRRLPLVTGDERLRLRCRINMRSSNFWTRCDSFRAPRPSWLID